MTRGLVATMAGLLLLGWASNAAAFCRMTTSDRDLQPGERCVTDGVPLEWRRRCLSYSVDERGSGDLPIEDIRRIARTSFDTWLAVTCGGVAPGFEIEETAELATCQKAEFNRSGGNVNTIAFVDDTDFMDGAFAITTVWHSRSTGQIYDADILLNQRLGPYVELEPSTCPDPADGAPESPTVDLQNVLTHEIGHFFGIGHSEMVNVTMSPVSWCRAETSKRILRTDDIDALCTIYPPGALPETCDFSPSSGLRLDCERSGGGGGGCAVTAPPPVGTPITWLTLLGAALLLTRRRRR